MVIAKKKANGEGSLSVEKATGLYRAAITDPTGKRVVKRFKERKAAVEWLTNIKSDIYKNTYIAPSNTTLGEWMMEYFDTYITPKVRPKTLQRYMQSSKFLEPLKEIPLQKITAHGVQKFYNSLPEMSDSSKNKIHKLLKAMVTKAFQLDMISKNFMEAVEPPKVTQKEVEIFTIDEIHKILDTIRTNRYYSKYYSMIYMAITTGARLGEILGLKRNCLKDGYITINSSLQEVNGQLVDMPPKTQAGYRRITINATLQQLLYKSLINDKVITFDGYVFHTSNGTAYSPRNIERVWKKILEIAELPHKNFHCLRHTHATQLLAEGVPLLEVAKRLGHSRASHTLNLYGHAIPGYDNDIPDKIDKILSL